MRRCHVCLVVAALLLIPAVGWSQTARPVKPRAAAPPNKPAVAPAAKWQRATNPKPLSQPVLRGLAWLAKTQHRGGGWSQGEESQYMGNSMQQLKDTPNVADTCIAALALMRSGSTPRSGPYAKNIADAVGFVCAEIEKSPPQGLAITRIQGTRVQMKLGQYIDTFLAALLLAEVKGQMPNPRSEDRVRVALQRTTDKIEKNQRNDGTWDDQGWAPVIGQNFATKALNRAAQRGHRVSGKVLAKAEGQARSQFDAKSGAFGGAGSAGVELYSASANLGGMQQSEITNREIEVRAKVTIKQGRTAAERKAAAATLRRIEANRADYQKAQRAVIDKLDDKQFVAGFGSNGGEEFLSYNSIGESLVAKGGPEWAKWDRQMTANLERIQNNDGTWTGHHCITGRTFCTAAALMVLTVDRAPVPIAEKVQRR